MIKLGFHLIVVACVLLSYAGTSGAPANAVTLRVVPDSELAEMYGAGCACKEEPGLCTCNVAQSDPCTRCYNCRTSGGGSSGCTSSLGPQEYCAAGAASFKKCNTTLSDNDMKCEALGQQECKRIFRCNCPSTYSANQHCSAGATSCTSGSGYCMGCTKGSQLGAPDMRDNFRCVDCGE